MTFIDITDLRPQKLETLIYSKVKTFRCCGCGETKATHKGYRSGDVCSDCVDWFVAEEKRQERCDRLAAERDYEAACLPDWNDHGY